MAIFHYHLQVISRSKGQNALAAAAYRSGTILISSNGEKFDYSHRNDVIHTEIFVPCGCPTIERNDLWNMSERVEKRKNSCVAREADIAIPTELSPSEKLLVVKNHCQWLADRYRVVVDCCHHAGQKLDEDCYDSKIKNNVSLWGKDE